MVMLILYGCWGCWSTGERTLLGTVCLCFSIWLLAVSSHYFLVFLCGGAPTLLNYNVVVAVVQSLNHVWLFVTPWTAARQASLSITNSRSLLKLMSIESVMTSNHLILCHPLLLLPSIFPSISLFKWVSSSHQVAKVLQYGGSFFIAGSIMLRQWTPWDFLGHGSQGLKWSVIMQPQEGEEDNSDIWVTKQFCLHADFKKRLVIYDHLTL